MAIREGKWKCPSCGTVNLGRHTACQSCGDLRGKDIQFFLEDDAPEVTDDEMLKTAEGGADWTCEFCGADNRAALQACHQCNAPRGAAMQHQEKIIPDQPLAPSSPSSEPDQPPVPSSVPTPAESSPPTPKQRGCKTLSCLALGVGAVVIFFAAMYMFVCRTTQQVLTVRDSHWERSIDIERESWVTGKDWKEDVPAGATILREWTEKAGTRQVQVGSERKKVGKRDKGNGFFEDVYQNVPVYRNEPVYKTKVEYRARKWMVYRTVRASGYDRDRPYWPPAQLATDEREGPRKETATVTLVDTHGKEYSNSITAEDAARYPPGGRFIAKINALGMIKELIPQ